VEQFRWPIELNNGISDGALSFSFGHIVDIVCAIPELNKESEVEWALVLGRVLNHTTIHHGVLDTRKHGEYEKLVNGVKKIRLQSHRMMFGVAQKNFQYGLDALVKATEVFIGISRRRKFDDRARCTPWIV